MSPGPIPRSMVSALDALLAPVVLVLLWLLFLRNALDGTTSFALFLDNEFFLGPVLSSMSESLRAGEWPLRMDTAVGGFPLYNFTQLTAFYPLYLTLLPIYESLPEVIINMHRVTLMHLLIMEINTYVLLRVIGVSRLGALTGAALGVFSANSMNYAVWVNIIAPYAWLPLFVAGIAGMMLRGPCARYSMMSVVGIVMLTFASPAQPLIHALFLAAVLCIFRFLDCRSRESRLAFMRDVLLPTMILGVLCLLLVSPALLPPVYELDNMIRWIGAFDPVYGGDRIPFAAFEAEQLELGDFGGVLFKFGDMAVGQQFTGVLVVGLALIKAFSRQCNWLTKALIFVAVYSLLSAFGSNLGLAYVNYVIPGLNKIREPTRFLYLFQFAVCALAALGLDELRAAGNPRTGVQLVRRQWLALLALLVLALLVWVLYYERIVGLVPARVPFFTFAALLLASWLLREYWFRTKGVLLALAWSAMALLLHGREVTWTPPPVSYSQYEQSNLQLLDAALARLVELDPAHDYRVLFGGEVDVQVAAMLGSYRGIRTLTAYVNPAPRQQFEQMYYFEPREDNYARVLGAKYLLCQNCSPAEMQGYAYVETVEGYDIYASDDVLPHTYVAHTATGTFSYLGEFIEAAATTPLDNSFLFLPAWTPDIAPMPVQQGEEAGVLACTSREQSRGINTVIVAAACDAPAMVVMNKFNDANWRARVDGDKVPVRQVNGNQLGVQVPAGSHSVEFYYSPVIVKVSLMLFVLGLVLLIAACVHARVRR